MKISKSSVIGLQAVGHISQQEGLVAAHQIVKENPGMELEYLMKILQVLVKAGILVSKRGPKGGFQLARPANKVSMLEIIEAIEGGISTELCSEGNPFVNATREAYAKAIEQAKKLLGKATIKSLAETKQG